MLNIMMFLKILGIVKPKELFAIKKQLEQGLQNGNNIKELVLNYIKQKYNNSNLSHVICQIDNSMDVADLHTLFNTEDIQKVVEGYAKSFSAVFWNYIDEKDESFFQVPTLMIMDSNCMDKNDTIKAIPYQRRKNGVDKITGESSMELNPIEFKKLIEADLNLDNAITLLKLKKIMDNHNLSVLIDDKLSNFELLEDANQVVEQDKILNEFYIIMDADKNKIKEEILNNTVLQEQLRKSRLNHTGQVDQYMATYVEILEEFDKNTYLQPKQIEKNIHNKGNKSIEDR